MKKVRQRLISIILAAGMAAGCLGAFPEEVFAIAPSDFKLELSCKAADVRDAGGGGGDSDSVWFVHSWAEGGNTFRKEQIALGFDAVNRGRIENYGGVPRWTWNSNTYSVESGVPDRNKSVTYSAGLKIYPWMLRGATFTYHSGNDMLVDELNVKLAGQKIGGASGKKLHAQLDNLAPSDKMAEIQNGDRLANEGLWFTTDKPQLRSLTFEADTSLKRRVSNIEGLSSFSSGYEEVPITALNAQYNHSLSTWYKSITDQYGTYNPILDDADAPYYDVEVVASGNNRAVFKDLFRVHDYGNRKSVIYYPPSVYKAMIDNDVHAFDVKVYWGLPSRSTQSLPFNTVMKTVDGVEYRCISKTFRIYAKTYQFLEPEIMFTTSTRNDRAFYNTEPNYKGKNLVSVKLTMETASLRWDWVGTSRTELVKNFEGKAALYAGDTKLIDLPKGEINGKKLYYETYLTDEQIEQLGEHRDILNFRLSDYRIANDGHYKMTSTNLTTNGQNDGPIQSKFVGYYVDYAKPTMALTDTGANVAASGARPAQDVRFKAAPSESLWPEKRSSANENQIKYSLASGGNRLTFDAGSASGTEVLYTAVGDVAFTVPNGTEGIYTLNVTGYDEADNPIGGITVDGSPLGAIPIDKNPPRVSYSRADEAGRQADRSLNFGFRFALQDMCNSPDYPQDYARLNYCFVPDVEEGVPGDPPAYDPKTAVKSGSIDTTLNTWMFLDTTDRTAGEITSNTVSRTAYMKLAEYEKFQGTLYYFSEDSVGNRETANAVQKLSLKNNGIKDIRLTPENDPLITDPDTPSKEHAIGFAIGEIVEPWVEYTWLRSQDGGKSYDRLSESRTKYDGTYDQAQRVLVENLKGELPNSDENTRYMLEYLVIQSISTGSGPPEFEAKTYEQSYIFDNEGPDMSSIAWPIWSSDKSTMLAAMITDQHSIDIDTVDFYLGYIKDVLNPEQLDDMIARYATLDKGLLQQSTDASGVTLAFTKPSGDSYTRGDLLELVKSANGIERVPAGIYALMLTGADTAANQISDSQMFPFPVTLRDTAPELTVALDGGLADEKRLPEDAVEGAGALFLTDPSKFRLDITVKEEWAGISGEAGTLAQNPQYAHTRYSVDGGTTWSEWQKAESAMSESGEDSKDAQIVLTQVNLSIAPQLKSGLNRVMVQTAVLDGNDRESPTAELTSASEVFEVYYEDDLEAYEDGTIYWSYSTAKTNQPVTATLEVTDIPAYRLQSLTVLDTETNEETSIIDTQNELGLYEYTFTHSGKFIATAVNDFGYTWKREVTVDNVDTTPVELENVSYAMDTSGRIMATVVFNKPETVISQVEILDENLPSWAVSQRGDNQIYFARNAGVKISFADAYGNTGTNYDKETGVVLAGKEIQVSDITSNAPAAFVDFGTPAMSSSTEKTLVFTASGDADIETASYSIYQNGSGTPLAGFDGLELVPVRNEETGKTELNQTKTISMPVGTPNGIYGVRLAVTDAADRPSISEQDGNLFIWRNAQPETTLSDNREFFIPEGLEHSGAVLVHREAETPYQVNVTVRERFVGGDAESHPQTVKYRYSTDGGMMWSDWTTATAAMEATAESDVYQSQIEFTPLLSGGLNTLLVQTAVQAAGDSITPSTALAAQSQPIEVFLETASEYPYGGIDWSYPADKTNQPFTATLTVTDKDEYQLVSLKAYEVSYDSQGQESLTELELTHVSGKQYTLPIDHQGTYRAVAVNSGGYTWSRSVTISNIDTQALELTGVSYSTEALTSKGVRVTLNFNKEDARILSVESSSNAGSLLAGDYEIQGNNTIYLRKNADLLVTFGDSFGNVRKNLGNEESEKNVPIRVGNIINAPPYVVPVMSMAENLLTSTLYFRLADMQNENYSDPFGRQLQDMMVSYRGRQYSAAEKTTVDGAEVYRPTLFTFSQNGDYEFVVYDVVGNAQYLTVTVGGIDRTAPVITKVIISYDLADGSRQTIEHTPQQESGWRFADDLYQVTNQNVTVELTADKPVFMMGNMDAESAAAGDYQQTASKEYFNNGLFQFDLKAKNGISSSYAVGIELIDKTPPTLVFEGAQEIAFVEDMTADRDASLTYNPDKLLDYKAFDVFNTKETDLTDRVEIDWGTFNKDDITQNRFDRTRPYTVIYKVSDRAGNVTEVRRTIRLVGKYDTILTINGKMPDSGGTAQTAGGGFTMKLENFSGTAYARYAQGWYTMGQMKTRGTSLLAKNGVYTLSGLAQGWYTVYVQTDKRDYFNYWVWVDGVK